MIELGATETPLYTHPAEPVAGRVLNNPPQVPPFISAPGFDPQSEGRAVLNGSLYLRADFAATLYAHPAEVARMREALTFIRNEGGQAESRVARQALGDKIND